MNGAIHIQFRMKSRHELTALPGCHDLVSNTCEHIGIPPYALNVRRANERHGNPPNAGKITFRTKTAELSTKGVSHHFDIHRRQMRSVIVADPIR